MINFLNFLFVIFLVLNLVWLVFIPVAFLLETKYWTKQVDDLFGKSATNGEFLKKCLGLWIWPVGLIMSIKPFIKWLKQPR